MGGKPIVLVVEDEELLLDVIASAFEDAGFGVLQAKTGAEAIAHLGSGQPIHLLLTDIRLPGAIDGWTIAEQARDRLAPLPVIYVTGFSHVAPRQVQGSLLLRKPYRPSTLIQAARQLGVG